MAYYFTLCDELEFLGNRDCANSAADVAQYLSGETEQTHNLARTRLRVESRGTGLKVARQPNEVPPNGRSVALVFMRQTIGAYLET